MHEDSNPRFFGLFLGRAVLIVLFMLAPYSRTVLYYTIITGYQPTDCLLVHMTFLYSCLELLVCKLSISTICQWMEPQTLCFSHLYWRAFGICVCFCLDDVCIYLNGFSSDFFCLNVSK